MSNTMQEILNQSFTFQDVLTYLTAHPVNSSIIGYFVGLFTIGLVFSRIITLEFRKANKILIREKDARGLVDGDLSAIFGIVMLYPLTIPTYILFEIIVIFAKPARFIGTTVVNLFVPNEK